MVFLDYLSYLHRACKYMLLWVASFFPSSILFGRTFRRARALQKKFESQALENSFFENYADFQLGKMLGLAGECDFYASYLKAGGISQQPTIDKDIYVKAGDSVVRSKAGADLVTTGGTSGKPLAFYINKDRRGFEWFCMTNGWSKAGFVLGRSWRAVLRNHSLGGRMIEVDPALREVRFDNFKLSESYLDYITQEISRRKIEFVHSYPSAAYRLASHWDKKGLVPPSVKAFLCGSENILNEQKDLIQNKLKIRMLTWYGHSEKLILAHEGETCENYHSIPYYGYTEIVNEDGVHVEPGEVGELVGTGFINTKAPFIRYRTGDYAEYVGRKCPVCGYVGTTFKNVRGRWSGDRVFLSDESYVTTTALNLHSSVYSHIDGLQYCQKKVGELEVRVIPNSNWSVSVENGILEELYKKVPLGLKITVEKVDELEYAKNRKFQLLIQKVVN